jgi:hypothetical protein
VRPAAIVGLLVLGDRIEPGPGWPAALGLVATLGAVIGPTRYAEPQHHHAKAPARRPGPRLRTATTSR